MGVFSRTGDYLPDAEMSELFEEGKIHMSLKKQPPYTKRNGDELMLRARSLYNPAVFIQALRDFVHAHAFHCWCHNKEEITFSEEEWQQHQRHSEDTLRREVSRYGTILSQGAVRDRLMGQSAEFVMAKLINTMLERFAVDPEMDVSVPIWSGEESPVDLGDSYFLQPFPGTNYNLYRKIDTKNINLGEQDMMVKAGNEIAFFIDVSTSATAVNAKIGRGKSPEKLFMDFRDNMRRLFQCKSSSKGYREVAKIHVICGSSKRSCVDVIPRQGGNCGVFKVQLPTYTSVRTISEKMFEDLQRSGVLTAREGDLFSLSLPSS